MSYSDPAVFSTEEIYLKKTKYIPKKNKLLVIIDAKMRLHLHGVITMTHFRGI